MRSRPCLHLFPLLVLLTAGVGTGALPPLSPRLEVVPPPVLSALEPNPVRILVESPGGGGGLLALEARDGEGRRAALGQRPVVLPPGLTVVEWELPPEALALFPVPRDITLKALLRFESGPDTEAEGEATLLLSAEAAGGGWSVLFSSHPLLVYTQRSSTLPLAVFNPQASPRQGEIRVKFLDGRKRKAVGAGSLRLRLEPGWNAVAFPVAASVTAEALARGDLQAKAVLRVGGIFRARDFAPLDYDLAASATASPSAGRAPLAVDFEGSASGGTPPYSLAWDFGDGSGAAGPSASHTYGQGGAFTAVLTVTDGQGGQVQTSRVVAVEDPLLTVSCGAEPASGPFPLTVAFTASASGGTGLYDFAWAFGDGTTSLEREPVHTFAAAGTYDATLTVLSGTQRETCTRRITAVPPSFTITATAGPGGLVSPAGPVVVPWGGRATFGFLPQVGHALSEVLVDGASVGPVPYYTFEDVRADHTIHGVFAEAHYTVTATAGPGGAVSPSGAVQVPAGTSLEVQILPAPRFRILDVLVDGVSVGPVSSYLFSGPSDHTLEALFQRTAYLVTATATIGGVLEPSGEIPVPVGESLTFTWSPDLGYHLADLLVDGVSVGTPPSYTFTNVQADHTVEARFARNTYTIYTTFTPGGTVLPNGNVTVFEGEDRTFTITPNPGFVTKEVVVDGVSIGPSRSHTFLAVDRDHYFHVVFEATTPRSYRITTLAGPGGSLFPSGLVLVGEGSDITFTVTPDSGHHTTDVLVDGT
ncbi:MAG: PKD domain-containing protein, partial [Acidobacteriota bacterium]